MMDGGDALVKLKCLWYHRAGVGGSEQFIFVLKFFLAENFD